MAKTKKTFIYLRIVIWLLVLRELINCSLELLFVVGYSDSILFKAIHYSNRAFLVTIIDIFEFFALCYLFRAQCLLSLKFEGGNENEVSIESLG
jgi:hypothetical protein